MFNIPLMGIRKALSFVVGILILGTLGLSQDVFAEPFSLFPTFVDSFSVAGQETNPTGVAFNSDGTKMFVVGSTGDDIDEYTLATAFDVSAASFVDSFSVMAQDNLPLGVTFSSDGTKMFVVGSAGDAVYEYTLTTAFDISTASFVDSFSVMAQESVPSDVTFSSDGTKMFVSGIVGDDINEYALTTAFDVSTASFVDSFSVAAQETEPRGVAFSSNGIIMFVLGADGNDINRYTLTTSFDVSTASFVDSFSVMAQENNPTGVALSSDGTKMFVVGFGVDNVNEYTLPGAFEFLPIFENSYSVAAQDTNPVDVAFSTDGTKMFVVGDDGDDVNEYTLPGAFTLSPPFVDSFSVAESEGISQGLSFNSDGTKMFVVGSLEDSIHEYTLATPFDVSTASFVDSFSVAGQEISPTDVAFNSDGTKMFVVGISGVDVNEYTLDSAFDVSTASFVDSFSVAGQDTGPEGVAFSPDGTKMFVVGKTGDAVYEYTLSTPFDVSISSFVDSFSVAAQETFPTDVTFSPDGTKMFVVGASGDDVNEYTLTTPFDVSAASFVGSFSVAAQETQPTGVAFSSDGTKMFVVGYTGDKVYEYTLSSPFTLFPTFVDSFSVAGQDTIPSGIAFSPDGKKMFVVGSSGNNVNEYTLPLAFDVSTASFVLGSFSVVAQESNPRGVAFSPDGTYMHVVGTDGDTVYEYILSTAFDVSTASWVDLFSVAAQEFNPRDVTFSSDGTKMFVVGATADNINEYTLTIPFEVSTASFVDSFSVAGQDTLPSGIAFSPDGTKMFVVGQDGDKVDEYTISIGKCSPPTSGDWVIETSCTLTSSAIINNGNLIVQNNSILTVPFTLDIDFLLNKITVESGSGILIQAGGTIT